MRCYENVRHYDIVNDEESAKKIFERVITDGIGLNLDFKYSVVDINREKKFIKVEVARKEARILILKNARRLKNKSILEHSNIFVTDDAPQSVREVRRKLFAVRLKLLNSGVNRGDIWVTKSIPPLLCIRQCPNTEPLKVTVDKVNKDFMDSVLAHIPHRVDIHRGGFGSSMEK